MKIVIVGASLGGLAAAACLLSGGTDKVSVRVLEKQSTRYKGTGAGIGIDDETLGELASIIPLEELMPKLATMRVKEERLAQGKTLLCSPLPFHAMIWKDM